MRADLGIVMVSDGDRGERAAEILPIAAVPVQRGGVIRLRVLELRATSPFPGAGYSIGEPDCVGA